MKRQNAFLILVIMLAALVFGCRQDEDFAELEKMIDGFPALDEEPLVGAEEASSVDFNDHSRALAPAIAVSKDQGGANPKKIYTTSKVNLNDKWSDGTYVRNSISSLHVYPGYVIIICSSTNYGGYTQVLGENKTSTSVWNVAGLKMPNGENWDNKINSIYIRKRAIWNSFQYLSNFPDNRENNWSREVQGVTHDNMYWYISSKWAIRKIHLSKNLDNSHDDKKIIGLPHNCGHIGDITFYNGRLFVPLEGCPGNNTLGDDRIYIYNTDGGIQKYAKLASQTHASWVAVNPLDGLMYSSNSDTNLINVYSPDFANGTYIYPLYTISLPFFIYGVQGGVFDDSGYLYLSNHKKSEKIAPGIQVLLIQGRKAGRLKYIGPNGYKPGSPYYEEIEGLTLWDLDARPLKPSSLKGGQLHWLLLDNDLRDEDDVFFKHVRLKW